ncbi:phosphotransferase enzyme family-domain-containing protein [Biscogniauxia mediterranea]|nr:phosphotransferase enzyme family-domain-containing protein [Biscogniauxia mediterranea]
MPATLTPSPSDHKSVHSDSSTLVYSQESFSTFQDRVVELCKNIWLVRPKDIIVERLKGGGYNRIIGITRQFDDEEVVQFQYVLRIPRSESSQVACDVAALLFVKCHTAIPVPTVIGFDTTNQNAILSTYMIQDRVPGANLFDTYLFLGHKDRCKVARELGDVYREILAVRSNTHGVLVPKPGDKNIESPIHVAPLPIRDFWEPAVPNDPLTVKPYSDSAPTQSTLEIFTSLFQARKAYRMDKYQGSDDRIFMDQFCVMASELDADGWFSDVPISLVHLDLGPHNILVDVDTRSEDPIISSILDWDSAVLFPMFLACEPPLWLWAWNEDEDEDERTANDIPPTLEARELKQMFEEAAGPDYMRFAYRPEYRLARKLSSFAIEGISSTDRILEAGKMLKEWRKLRQSYTRF